jgi:hypothetical protein
MTENLKKIGIFLVATIVTAIITAVITAWIVGQPLTGLTGLNGFTETFFSNNVPAWAFALALLGALFFGSTLLRGIFKNWRKAQIHFVPDMFNNHWSIYGEQGMYVQLSGTFTYDGPPGDVTILRATVEGNSPHNMDIAVNPCDGSGQPITTTSLNLQAKIPQDAAIHLWLRTRIGTYGKLLKAKIVLQDNLKHNFSLGEIELPYSGGA